jgi:hypothetical protein
LPGDPAAYTRRHRDLQQNQGQGQDQDHWPVSRYLLIPCRQKPPEPIAPIAATLVATILNLLQRASPACIGGVLGVLIGADLLRFKDIRNLGPIASIGGAGTFDGVFVTGLLASLLA